MSKAITKAALGVAMVIAAIPTTSAFAQVPVRDDATLSQATKTAENTAQIMSSNSDILQTVNKTLAAVTGNRSTAEIAGTALGNGFSMGNAPDFSSLLQGQMAWGNLGSFGNTAATILNGLNLVKSLSGRSSGSGMTRGDKAYQGLVNTATALTASIAGTQSAAAIDSLPGCAVTDRHGHRHQGIDRPEFAGPDADGSDRQRARRRRQRRQCGAERRTDAAARRRSRHLGVHDLRPVQSVVHRQLKANEEEQASHEEQSASRHSRRGDGGFCRLAGMRQP